MFAVYLLYLIFYVGLSLDEKIFNFLNPNDNFCSETISLHQSLRYEKIVDFFFGGGIGYCVFVLVGGGRVSISQALFKNSVFLNVD